MDAEPNYKGRLIFAEMGKPKPDDRPEDWIAELKAEINNSLQNQSSIELLWAWNDLVKESCAKIGQDMTSVAQAATVGTHRELNDGLKATMQHLAAAQSAGDFSTDTAPRHLLTVLTQLLMDQLEHPTGIAGISAGGVWLSETPPGAVADSFPGKMNGLLLTSDNSVDGAIYAPGTVFKIADPTKFSAAFGKEIPDLMAMWIKQTAAKWTDWQRDAQTDSHRTFPYLRLGARVSSKFLIGCRRHSANRLCRSSQKKRGRVRRNCKIPFAVAGRRPAGTRCSARVLPPLQDNASGGPPRWLASALVQIARVACCRDQERERSSCGKDRLCFARLVSDRRHLESFKSLTGTMRMLPY